MIPIKWDSPAITGGCAITSYAILRSSGKGINSPNLRVIHSDITINRPSIRNFVVTDLPTD